MNYARETLLTLSPSDLVDLIFVIDGAMCGVSKNLSNLIAQLPSVKTNEDGDALINGTMASTALVVQSAEEYIQRKLCPSPTAIN